MPFLAGPKAHIVLDSTQPTDPPPVVLEAAGTDDFKLLTALVYEDGTGTQVNVPKSGTTTTDLASVPKPLWGILAPYGHQLRPALLHDYLCDEARKKPTTTAKVKARREADSLFREALADCGASALRRNLFWAGVSFGRYLAFRTVAGLVLALLALVFAVAFWATLYVGVFSDGGWSSLSLGWHTVDGWTWWPGLNALFSWFAWPLGAGLLTVALVGLLGVVPLLYFKDASFVCLALLVAPIVTPVFLLTVATLGVLYVLDLAVTTVMWFGGKTVHWPVVGPTFRWDVSK